jgi:hypothetical protein
MPLQPFRKFQEGLKELISSQERILLTQIPLPHF